MPFRKPLVVSLITVALTSGLSFSQIKSVQAASEVTPVLSLVEQGQQQAEQGNLQAAIADLSQVIELEPDFVQPYLDRSVILAATGNLPQALNDLDQVIALAPDNADAYYNRGKVYTELGRAEAALADLDTAIELNPELAEAYGNRFQLGNPQIALTDLQQAAELFQVRGDQQG